jgi:hypothetical protein
VAVCLEQAVMADTYYFHYTSSVAAQMIVAVGRIEPRNGAIYLTDELFPSGHEAARFLAIPPIGPSLAGPSGITNLTKPVDVVCCIPATSINENALQGPDVVAPFRDWPTGNILYSGGGRQFRYGSVIDVRGVPWLTLGRP